MSPAVGQAGSARRALLFFLCLVALVLVYLGPQLVASRPAPARHPLTGREIAGIATNAEWMDRPERDAEDQPDRALELVGIAPGMVVADVGAGTGYMTVRIAHLVGPQGKVLANELQPAMLRTIAEKVRRAQLSNVELVQGSEDDARLPDAAVDLALLVDVYHELSHPQAMLRSIRRSLKPDGRLVLIEYRKEDPSIPIADAHRMKAAEARAEVEAEGFAFDRPIEGLPRHHILVFRPAPS